MKITRLSSTEVANIATLPIERRNSALLKIENPSVWWNYSPVVNALPKILLASSPLFGDLQSGDDNVLVQSIVRECKSGVAQSNACEGVARALIDWRNENSVVGRIVRSEPLRLTVDTLRYCSDVVAVIDAQAYVLNLDPRSKMTLSAGGKEFIKSLIHHTALIGDLRDARAALLATRSIGDGNRVAKFEVLDGEPFYSLDDILSRINETYSIWELILRNRRDAAAKDG